MRRISAVVLTTGALAAGLGAVAAPANAAAAPAPVEFEAFGAGASGSSVEAAAPKAKSWKAPNSFPRVAASGKYTRGPKRVWGGGTLSDGGRDGWQACVRLKVVGPRKTFVGGGCIARRGTSTPVDARASVKFKFNWPRGNHFYVQEVRRNMETGKYKYGKWKRVY